MEDGAPDPGIARAGATVAARRRELGISQRQLAREGIINATALIRFEKGRTWPRERTRHVLEEILQWPAGTIARIRDGEPAEAFMGTGSADSADGEFLASLVADAVQPALIRFDQAIADLPPADAPEFVDHASVILADLRKLEQIGARAVRHSRGSAVEVVKALGVIRRRYDELMLRTSEHPAATLGQRLYAARHRANLTASEVAAISGLPDELVVAVENGAAVDDAEKAARIEALIQDLDSDH